MSEWMTKFTEKLSEFFVVIIYATEPHVLVMIIA